MILGSRDQPAISIMLSVQALARRLVLGMSWPIHLPPFDLKPLWCAI